MGNIFSSLYLFAHSVTEELTGAYEPEGDDLEAVVGSLSVRIVGISAIALMVLTLVAMLYSQRFPKLKAPLFVSMAVIMMGSTLFLAASTIYVNVNSDSGGPVHWHADLEIWACGNELELKDPFELLSNKIGTPTLHEHDDHRIHLEGVVVDDSRDATLGKFFHVIDGALTANALVVPLNAADAGGLFEDEVDGDGASNLYASYIDQYIEYDDEGDRYARFISGQTCGDQTAYVQVFVYNWDEATKTYQQQKIADPVTYSISEEPNVPPGDCIIVEYDILKDQTDKLCKQYGVRDIDRCEQFGVEANLRDICEYTQVDYPSQDPNLETTEHDESEAEPSTHEDQATTDESDQTGPLNDGESSNSGDSEVML